MKTRVFSSYRAPVPKTVVLAKTVSKLPGQPYQNLDRLDHLAGR